ncbi:protein BCCIP homolog [Carya illinoinensis]|uniref:protein BCCIP homolog n=1 Tax=Carya illinoinensis TaxID=32201 RepID=UPI001C71E9CA|nr:protein BCCIP homolog [Carya illinoinensis]
MPRRPIRHCRSLKPWPLTFSSFVRSVAQLASSYMAKRQMHNFKIHRESPRKSADTGYLKHTPDEKSERSVSSDEEEFEGVVQAEFAFFDPKLNDFHGVKTLLQTYLDTKQWDLSGFVDLILGQTTVGTVVKIEGDEDDGVFALVTVLNLQRYKDHKFIMDLKDFLLKAYQENDVVDKLRSIVGEQAQNVGILVSQHVVNLLCHLPCLSLVTAFFPNVLQLSLWSFSFPLLTRQPATHEVCAFLNIS